MYYITYCGVLDQLIKMRDELLIAKEQDYLKKRKEILQSAIDKLNESIFDLNNAIEFRKEGTVIEKDKEENKEENN